MNQFPIFLNLKDERVILLGEGEAADAKRRLLERAGATITDDEAAAAKIAYVAIESEAETRRAVERLRARGLLVNAVDRPELCDFTTPAIVDRDPVLVAIGTGGSSAGLAKALRQRLEALLPPSLGRLARALFAAREAIRARFPDGAERRRAIDAALGEGGPLDPMHMLTDQAVIDWLARPGDGTRTGRFKIRLRSNDPDDLTLGEARLLASADRVVHDAGVPPAILARIRADAAVSVADGEAVEVEADEVLVILRGPV